MTKEEFKPQAVLCICNCLALEVMLDESGDYVYYKYSNSNVVEEAKVIYEDTCIGLDCDIQSHPYFYTDSGIKYDIADFIRTNL